MKNGLLENTPKSTLIKAPLNTLSWTGRSSVFVDLIRPIVITKPVGSMLFDGDSHQLTARSHASKDENLSIY